MQKPIKIDVKIDMEKHVKFCSEMVVCGNEAWGEGMTPLSRMRLPRGLGPGADARSINTILI